VAAEQEWGIWWGSLKKKTAWSPSRTVVGLATHGYGKKGGATKGQGKTERHQESPGRIIPEHKKEGLGWSVAERVSTIKIRKFREYGTRKGRHRASLLPVIVKGKIKRTGGARKSGKTAASESGESRMKKRESVGKGTRMRGGDWKKKVQEKNRTRSG